MAEISNNMASVKSEISEKSRTEYSMKNTSVAMISRMIAILMGFVTRVVFTHTLNESYVGINGLFSDILNVLSLSELGVGTAITYALYKPIANRDIEKQKSIMKMYQHFYTGVAVFVLLAGLLIVPFLDVFVKNQPDVDNLVVIYLLYLANSVLSYLLIYKKTLIDAHQLSYIGVMYQTIFLVIQDTLQIVILLCTKNFILFLLVYLACTLLNNLSVSRKAEKLYPFLKDKQVQPLPKAEKNEIFKNVKAMLMHKVGNVMIGNTDNLLLSSIVGIVSVGCYSNYYLLIGSVRQILNQVFQGITASVGNLGVTSNKSRVHKIFSASFFVGQWMFGFATIALYHLLNPFVEFSFGEQYVFDKHVVLILCLNFYVTGMRQATLVFRDSLGLFWHDRYKSVIEAMINLVASIILANRFGTAGVFWGTFISTMLTSFWVEPWVLYHQFLKKNSSIYFVKYVVYSGVTLVAGWLTHCLCQLVSGGLVTQMLWYLIICLVVPNVIFLICYVRTKEFQFLFGKLQQLLSKYCRRSKKGVLTDVLSEEEQQLLENLAQCLDKERKELSRNALNVDAKQETPEELNKKDIDENDTNEKDEKRQRLEMCDWDTLIKMARSHAVTSLLYPLWEKEECPKQYQQDMVAQCRQVVRQSYHLLFFTKYVVDLLETHHIPCVVLKGAATSVYYPVLELRKSGDVDILIPIREDVEKAEKLLIEQGFTLSELQNAHHQRVWYDKNRIELELHIMLAEPFDDKTVNQYLQSFLKKCIPLIERKEIIGVELPVFSEGVHAFHLLLHMLQHFLRAGFGVKLLCDWVVFWNDEKTDEQIQEYQQLICDIGLEDFSDMITYVCMYYLGLQEQNARRITFGEFMQEDVQEFMKDILAAEEFGHSDVNRMVILRGTKWRDYVREFHHQMHLNYPKAGRCPVLWPALWVATLVRFLHNNKKVRSTSGFAILREARRRSKRMDKMKLFHKK